jgi:hypothetical protein
MTYSNIIGRLQDTYHTWHSHHRRHIPISKWLIEGWCIIKLHSYHSIPYHEIQVRWIQQDDSENKIITFCLRLVTKWQQIPFYNFKKLTMRAILVTEETSQPPIGWLNDDAILNYIQPNQTRETKVRFMMRRRWII